MPVPQTTLSYIQQTITWVGSGFYSTILHSYGKLGRVEAVSVKVTRRFRVEGVSRQKRLCCLSGTRYRSERVEASRYWTTSNWRVCG